MLRLIHIYFLKKNYRALFQENNIEIDEEYLNGLNAMNKDEIAYERRVMKEGLTGKVLCIINDESAENESFRAGLILLLNKMRQDWLSNRENNVPTHFDKHSQLIRHYIEERTA